MKKTFFDSKSFRWAVIGTVVVVAGLGLYFSGSPVVERQRRLDDQRTQDLQQITYAVDQFNQQNARLPSSLDELRNSQSYVSPSILNDPESNAPFDYRTTGTSTYELCATFSTVLTDANNAQPMAPAPYGAPVAGFWNHAAGHVCYSLHVTPTPAAVKPPPAQ